MPEILLHMCPRREWERSVAAGVHAPASLAEQGFVHLSSPDQVHLPANRLYAGRDDILLLEIDAARVGATVRWEPGVPGDPESMRFPHLYGPLPIDAVVRTRKYLPGEDGVFARAGSVGD